MRWSLPPACQSVVPGRWQRNRNLRTEYGKLSFTLVERGQHVVAQVSPACASRPGASFSAPWDRTLVGRSSRRRADWAGQ